MRKILFFIFISLIYLNGVLAETEDITPNAKSAILIEASTGEVIFEKNIHEKFSPASMTKMMSMLIIMENIENGNLKWDELIKASEKASSMGGSQIYLETGELMSVEDLVKGIAIGSANDSTVALAERIAGTEDLFVEMMNNRAKQLNLINTNFKNSHGLDTANHYSSAHDMAVIARELSKHKKILEFSSIYETYLRDNTDKKFWLVNTNKLVRFYKGADGLKTGFTDEAKYCLTATANKNNMRLIAVVMGEPTTNIRNSEVSSLLDYGYNLYQRQTIIEENKILGNIKIYKGETEEINVVPKEEVSILLKKGSINKQYTYNLKLNNINAPIKVGDKVGTIEILEDGTLIREVDATISKDIRKANIFKLYFRHLGDIISGDIKLV